MFRVAEEQSERHSAAVTLTLQTLIDARHNINRNPDSARISGTRFPGQHNGQRRGQGMEFIDLRQYNEGDDVRYIDWNVTARSNEPYTRLYREERERVTTVIVDLRPMMFTGSDCLRSVSAGLFAACTLWQACEYGDRCAAMVISANGITSTRPHAGKVGLLRSLELIASGFAVTDNHIHKRHAAMEGIGAKTTPVLSEALNLINANRSASSRYILFSGLDTKDDSKWRKLLPATAMTGKLKVVLLLDRLEQELLPAGKYRFQSNRGATATVLNKANRNHYAEELQQNLQARSKPVTANGIPLLSVSTTVTPTELLTSLQQSGIL